METTPSSPEPAREAPVPAGGFRTTHWSAVLLAGRDSLPGAAGALEELCRTYWYPLYFFVRRRGYGHEDAQDLVQGFFGSLLERRDLATVHPEKGRFRTFLLTSLTHHLANEWDRRKALKRGGAYEFIALEPGDSEERFGRDAIDGLSPEAGFDRAWASQVLRLVLARLREECVREGGVDRYEALKDFLLGDRGNEPYVEVARRLGTTESGVKSAVYRLRRRLRDLFREEIGRTVSTTDDIDEELRYLIRTMTG